MSRPARDLSGQTVLVTGATSGIGRSAARDLARRGALVVLGVRDVQRGRRVAAGIAESGGRAEVLAVDLASFASVREAASRLLVDHPSLDVLVNNAGVAERRRSLSADGHERTWATNFLGGFLLTRLLLPALKRASAPRVVNVSSEAHRRGRLDFEDLELSRGWRTLRAYANSKLAQILFTRELARREREICVNAVHPGTISTRIWRAAPMPLEWLIRLVLSSAEKGAAPVVYLAADPDVRGVTGSYFVRFREATPSAAARNDADAARLWDVASRAVGYDERP